MRPMVEVKRILKPKGFALSLDDAGGSRSPEFGSSPSQRTSNGLVRSTEHGHVLSQVKTLARPVSVQCAM